MSAHPASVRVLRASAALALCLLPVLLAGCSNNASVLAKVGDQTITLEDFQNAARGNESRYAGSPDSAKTALLEDLVKRAVLVAEARKNHVVPDSTLERTRKENANRMAMEALLQKLAPPPGPSSDAETRELYRQRAKESHMLLIYTLERERADAAVKDLAAGQPFDEVAKRYSVAGILPPGGDLGWLAPGAMVGSLDDMARTGEVGKLLGPTAAPGMGWFVGKVTERRDRKQEPYETQKATLDRMIQGRKQRDEQQKAYESLRDQYKVVIENGGPQAMFMRLQGMNTAMMQGMAQPVQPRTPQPGDEKKILARYAGENGKPSTYTLADALTDLADPMGQRPDPSNIVLVRQWIESQIVRRASELEAKRRHLTEDPAVARRIQERVDNLLLQEIYGRQVMARVSKADSADVRAAYARRASFFVHVDEATVVSVTLADSAAARVLAEPGPAGVVKQRAATIKGAKVAEKTLRFPTDDKIWSMLESMLTGMNPGDVRGPLRLPEGWFVFQLASKRQSQRPLEKLESNDMHAVQAEAIEMARDRTLNQYTDSLRRAMPVKLYPDRLKKVTWPIPPAKTS